MKIEKIETKIAKVKFASLKPGDVFVGRDGYHRMKLAAGSAVNAINLNLNTLIVIGGGVDVVLVDATLVVKE